MPGADKLKVFRLLVALDVRFRDLNLVAILGMAKADASVLEPGLDLSQIIIKLLLYVINALVSAVKDFIYAWLRLRDFLVAIACYTFPLDQ